jgi:hypothetical protein
MKKKKKKKKKIVTKLAERALLQGKEQDYLSDLPYADHRFSAGILLRRNQFSQGKQDERTHILMQASKYTRM